MPRKSSKPSAATRKDLISGETSGKHAASALVRGVRILQAFRMGDEGLTNVELVRRTHFSKPTVSRLTSTLTDLGCLHHNAERGRYELGGAIVALGKIAAANASVLQVLRPEMRKVAARYNVHVGVGALDGRRMLYLEVAQGPSLVVLNLPEGSRIPVLTTAMGWAYLHTLTDSERREYLQAKLPEDPDEAKRVMSTVERALREIDQRGFCYCAGEWEPQVRGVAAPLVVGGRQYAVAAGAPAYVLSSESIRNEIGEAISLVVQRSASAFGR
jgi:DNA-binding IclR family transcriptional regulator